MGYRNWYLTEVAWLYLWIGECYYEHNPIYLDSLDYMQWDRALTAKELQQLECFSYVIRTWDQFTGSLPLLHPEPTLGS